MTASMRPLEQFRTLVLSNQLTSTGVDTQSFYMVSGSRLVVGIQISAIDPGTTITVDTQTSVDSDGPFTSIGTQTTAALGLTKQAYIDFFGQMQIVITTSGGNASYKLAVASYDNTSVVDTANPLAVHDDAVLAAIEALDPSGGVSGFTLVAGYPKLIAVSPSASVQLLPANPNRKEAIIINNTPYMVWVQLTVAASIGVGWPIAPNGSWTINSENLFKGIVNGIALMDGYSLDIYDAD